ncbi:MAG: NUDIX hydrolase [Spirochaetes bacterium]|nr:MAG: NUDIX hydrolase [Spirochaetota bacterium]
MERRSVAGIVVCKEKVLIGKRKPGGPIGLLWEFPGGKVEDGESDAEALHREFLEEFDVEVKPLCPLGSSKFQSSSGERILTAWLVAVKEGAEFVLKEHSRIAWVLPQDLGEVDLADSDKKLLPILLQSLQKALGQSCVFS